MRARKRLKIGAAVLLVDLYGVLGAETFVEGARSWAPAKLGLRAGARGELVTVAAYAQTACGSEHEGCKKLLDDAVAKGCGASSGQARELLDGWLASNANALQGLHRASERPVLYVPIDEDAVASMSAGAVFSPLFLLKCRAERRLDQGETAAAVGDLVALWKLARLLVRDQDALLAMAGIKSIELGYPIARTFAADAALSRASAERLLRALPVLEERALLLAMTSRARIEALLWARTTVRASNAKAATSIASGFGRIQLVDLGTALRRVNEGFDVFERAVNEPTSTRRVAAVKRAYATLLQRAERKPSRVAFLRCIPMPESCALPRSCADGALLIGTIVLTTVAKKLDARIAALEETRRALSAARDRSKPAEP